MYSFKFFSIILFTLLAHQGICEGQTMIPANGQCLVNGVLIGICVDGYGCCIDWRGQGFCRTECWATHRWSLHSKGCPYLVHILLLMTTSLAAKMKGLCFNQLLNRCTMLKKSSVVLPQYVLLIHAISWNEYFSLAHDILLCLMFSLLSQYWVLCTCLCFLIF